MLFLETFKILSTSYILLIYGIIFLALIFFSLNFSKKHKIARIIILIFFIVVFINPKKNVKENTFYKNIVIVVLDKTQSITETNKISQINEINTVIDEKLNKFKKFIKKEVILKNDSKNDINHKGTLVFSKLKKELNKIKSNRIAGIIIVTDGQLHDLENYTNKLDSVPIHFIIAGNKVEKDRVLKTENIPEYALVGENVNFSLFIEDLHSSEKLTVDIVLDGKKYKSIKIMTNEKYNIDIPVQHTGENILEMKVNKSSTEISEINNYQIHKIKGIHDKLRVMLISGEPNMGLRNLRNILNSDPSTELIHFTILRPPSKSDSTPVKELSLIPFPTQELFAADISKFSLIIFDQYGLQGALPQKYLNNISNFVLNGGALLDISGPEYAKQGSIINSPLKTILPTKPLDAYETIKFKPKLTTIGERHPITNNLNYDFPNNSWGNWFRFVKTQKLSGKVLLEHKSYPILVAAKAGDGRVVQLLSDQSWIWKKSIEERGPITTLLRNTIHWLLKTPELEENFLEIQQKEDLIKVSINTLEPGNSQALVVSPTNKEISFFMKDEQNGTLRGQFTSNEIGRHKITVKGITKFIYVGNQDFNELEDLRSTETKINPLIQEKKNITSYWYEDGFPEIIEIFNTKVISGKNWIGIKEKKVSKNEQYVSKDSFDWYLLLPLFLVLFMYSWYRESKD